MTIRDMVQPQRRSRYVRNDDTTWVLKKRYKPWDEIEPVEIEPWKTDEYEPWVTPKKPKKPKRRPVPEPRKPVPEPRKRVRPVETKPETKPEEQPVPEEDIDTERFKKIERKPQACVRRRWR